MIFIFRNVLAMIFLVSAFLLLPWLPGMPSADLPTILFIPALLALHLFLRQAHPDNDVHLSLHFFSSVLPWLWIFLFTLAIPALAAGSLSLYKIAQYQSGAISRWLAFSDPFDLAALLVSMAAVARMLSAIEYETQSNPEGKKRKQLWVVVIFFLVAALQVTVWLGAGFIPGIQFIDTPQTRVLWIMVLFSKILVWMGFQLTLWHWHLVWDKLAALELPLVAFAAAIILICEVVYTMLTNHSSLTGLIYWMQIMLAAMAIGAGIASATAALLLGRAARRGRAENR